MPLSVEKRNLLQKDIDEELKKRKNDDDKFKVFHHALNREDAEKLLKDHYKKNKINGTFLVRTSGKPNSYALSVINENECKNYLLLRAAGSYYSLQYTDAEEQKKTDSPVNGIDTIIRSYQLEKKNLCCVLSSIFIPGESLPVDVRSKGIKTLLHETVAHGDELNKLKLILQSEFCPDINEKDEDGRTALDIACEYDNVDAIKEIIKHNPLMNLRANDSYTPLHRAAEHDAIYSIEYILSNNFFDPTSYLIESFYVPLHVAVENNNHMSVKMFLKYNVADKPRSSSGKTPLDIAIENNYEDIIKILKKIVPTTTAKSSDWLHDESVTRQIAEQILSNAKVDKGDGAFLVRRKPNKLHVLSVTHENEYLHYEIDYKLEEFYCLDSGPYFPSLEHLIDYQMRWKDGMPTLLRSPISASSKYCHNLRNPKNEKVNKTGTVKAVNNRKRVSIFEIAGIQIPKKHGKKILTIKDIKLEDILGEGISNL